MTIEGAISNAINEFHKAVEHLKSQYGRLQIGRASAALVEDIPVEVYGVFQPLKALASISVPDPRTIHIQPWDRNTVAAVEKGIVGVNLGLNPINDGVSVRIPIPPLTEERRTDLTKHVHQLAEDARISVRTARQEAHNTLKNMKADGEITEDDWYSETERLQKKVEDINKQIDEMAKNKEKDVMTV